MRAVIQRVSSADVKVGDRTVGSIGCGLLVLLAVHRLDTKADADWLVNKIVRLRLFPDGEQKMNLSVSDVGGQILAVSQFTLYGDCRRGCRPSYSHSAPPDSARELYAYFVERMRTSGLVVQEGEFQAHMQVSLLNDGPVTVIVDSPNASKEDA